MSLRHIIPLAAMALLCFMACQSPKQKAQATATEEQTAEADSTAAIQADEPDINFTMTDINGKQVKAVEEFAKHKITVIDFWASWCGPCRQEMPNLVSLYDKYKDKGLGIIGISLDENRSDWEKAVKSMNMTWVQLSELNGWDNSVARTYGIQAIPFTIIVDQNGNLAQAGLRGEELATYIENMLR
ncbi:MAG: TlpA disulfide reductase family protein [Prevotellaceae bacterium]|nr:TlpA disulfide reductase family protein [Prevotellaceae bacterium]